MEKPYGLTMRAVVKNNKNEILLLRRHPESRTNPHKWELPGGKVDPGEFFDEALVRELKEETNLKVTIGDFYEAIQDDYPHKRTVQLVMNVNIISGELKISDEHDAFKWVKKDELKNLDISSALEKTLKKKNWEI
ncbi:NUDIX domain-containing protein [Methanobrevibacter sp. OttesenSCG-928-K11]|nr:NUDIX domain-containing protein [Methanobrevibacter sp. OttesenSCG-928-K11]MDL2270408.1 NUDIX domain-containing protein [Methanobrevibacter sp. OttesenSCG-928-I08]